MKLEKLSLGTKVMFSQALTGGLLVLLGATALVSMVSIEKKLRLIVEVDARKLELSGKIATAVADGESAQRGMLLGALTANEALVRNGTVTIDESVRELESALKQTEGLLYSEEGKRIFAALKSASDEWVRQVPAFQNHIKGQRFDQATAMQAEVFAPLLARMHEEAGTLSAQLKALMSQSSASAAGLMNFIYWFSMMLSIIATAVSAAAFWMIRGSSATLRRLAGELAEGSRQVASAAHQVSSSSQALAQGASEQAATLEETSASTEEINSMTQKNAENASTAATETEKADQLLKETDEKLTQMIGSMKEINTSSEKISKIIRVIDEIAFQTNILALNAAVEAARAGEAGMGFAVVADEVRNLAQRCAQAAKDTSDLIEESIVRSNEGKVRLDEVAASITRVFENASRIRLVANEVHVGSQEQARGIEQIARAVTQMQQVTQSNAASAEEGASAGEEMSAQAQTLLDSVEQLRVLVGGEATEVRGTRPRQKAAVTAAVTVKKPALAAATHFKPKAASSQIPLEGDFQDF
jgi:methyl-accepting chemotaxis protein/methyl-accepting chemotaxis protein-1 (serine sensor receptor)